MIARKARSLVAPVALAALLLGAAPASAQLTPQSGPIDISADRLEVFDAEGRAVFTGNVDAIQGGANLRADRVEVFFDREPGAAADGAWGEIRRMHADGDVFYVTGPDERAHGDHAIYDIESNTILMTGDVVLQRGENVITGSELRVDLNSGESMVRSAGGQQDAEASERVRAVFVSNGDDEDGDGEDDGGR